MKVFQSQPNFITLAERNKLSRNMLSVLVTGFALTALMAMSLTMPEVACAQAAGGDMPWISGLCKVSKLLTGPIAGAIAIIILAIMGLSYAAGEEKSVMSRGGQIIIGLSFTFFAASLVEYFMGGSVSGFLCR